MFIKIVSMDKFVKEANVVAVMAIVSAHPVIFASTNAVKKAIVAQRKIAEVVKFANKINVVLVP